MSETVRLNPEWEEPVKVDLVPEGEKLWGVQVQPGATTMLEGVQVIRDNRLAVDMDWGRPELEIPFVQMENLKRRYPELASPDHDIKLKAWKRFLADPESLPYRVRGRGRFMGRSVGGI